MRAALTRWTTWAPPAAAAVLAATWGRDVPGAVLALAGLLLVAAVLAAVHHAEVVAHRVGEPFGSLVLAVAVTVIEVGMIVMLMTAGKDGAELLARDTVFAAVMVTTNLIVGLALFTAAGRGTLAHFHREGSSAALSTVLVVAVMTLVLPTFTTSAPTGVYTTPQLVFASLAALAAWALFVLTQTSRHRDFFLPVDATGRTLSDDEHAAPPSPRAAWSSLGLLLASLVAVVGLAKVLSPAIESGVRAVGLPTAFVGLVIALVVLAPETLAAHGNARRGRTQIALNLAYGSAIASIGLTVPAVAVLATVLGLPLVLGLGPLHLAMLALTAVVSVLTVLPGRATRLQGALHLIIAVAFVFLSAVP